MSRFPAAGILPLCVNLAYYERKDIRITPKNIIMNKNIEHINDVRLPAVLEALSAPNVFDRMMELHEQ